MIFIVPWLDKERACGRFARYVPVSIPFGVGMLAGYIMERGRRVAVVDECVLPLIKEDNIRTIAAGFDEPYIFGISSVTANVGRGYELAKLIKKSYPGSKVIMGGIHPTILPQEALVTGWVDIVIRGEGEVTMDKLYQAIKNGDDYSHIPGISFINKAGLIQHNEDAPLLEDLNLLPRFPYQLFERHADKYNFGFLMASRGCPYDCIFCSQRKISGKMYRFQTVDKIADQIETLADRYKVSYFNFYDDNLVVNRKWTKELCEVMCQRGFYRRRIKFSCSTRGDAVNEEMLECMKKAGFVHLDIGLETASERLMKIIKKGESVADVIHGVKLAKRHGFTVGGVFIMGLPTETKEERHACLRLARELSLDFVRFNNACPYPGTELFNIAKRENRLRVEENWGNFTSLGAFVGGFKLPYVPTTCTEEELKRDIIKANNSFFLTAKGIFTLLFGGRHWFYLPQRWYLSLREWLNIMKLGINVLFPAKERGQAPE